jgi:hypothetical protein
MPVRGKYGDGMVNEKEVNEKLLFWILMVQRKRIDDASR